MTIGRWDYRLYFHPGGWDGFNREFWPECGCLLIRAGFFTLARSRKGGCK